MTPASPSPANPTSAANPASAANTANTANPTSTASPANTANRVALTGAVVRLRRLLLGAAALLVVLEAAWTLLGGRQRPLPTLLVAATATTVLLCSIWVVLGRMVRSGAGRMPLWVMVGYLARIGILVAALLGGRAAGLDTQVVGVSLIAAVLVGTLGETVVLARTRILTVEPRTPGPGQS